MNLIYTIAYGSNAWHQCVLMVQSMRTYGAFTGDIIVFTDTDAHMDGATVHYRPELAETFSIMGLRWEIGSGLDVSKYDYVAMIDTDIVAMKPVEALFAGEPGCVHVPEEYPHGRATTGHSPWTIQGVPFEDAKPVHNCGSVFGHAKSWNMFSGMMWALIRRFRSSVPFPYQWIDQQVLNHIERHQMFPVKTLPYKWVVLCEPTGGVTEDTMLVHCLPGGSEKVHVMQIVYSLLELHK